MAQNLRIINEFLQRFEILPFDEKALRQYAMIDPLLNQLTLQS